MTLCPLCSLRSSLLATGRAVVGRITHVEPDGSSMTVTADEWTCSLCDAHFPSREFQLYPSTTNSAAEDGGET
jgi:hypothetical protein